MRDFFQEGGVVMYPIALLGLVALGVAAVAFAGRSKAAAVTALALGGMAMVLGVGGAMWGRVLTDSALGHVPADQVERLRLEGYREAMRPLQLGGAVAGVVGALGVVAFVLAARSGSRTG